MRACMLLQSANILLARDDTAKLADVGLSHALVTKTHVVNSVMRGTWSWAAPETITGLRCTEKVDIWSFGIGEHPLIDFTAPVLLMSFRDAVTSVAY